MPRPLVTLLACLSSRALKQTTTELLRLRTKNLGGDALDFKQFEEDVLDSKLSNMPGQAAKIGISPVFLQ